MSDQVQSIICDPQTSGGLLVMVNDEAQEEFQNTMNAAGFKLEAIGKIIAHNQTTVKINA